MFNENLKMLRKRKGFTQEELAIKAHVVRQTVSKWEKGLSVPDADALQKIAEALDVSVNELLGADIKEESNKNEIAEQLARVNEQLVIRNRRWSRFWKVIGIIVLVSLVLQLAAVFLFSFVKDSEMQEISVQEEVIDDEITEDEVN